MDLSNYDSQAISEWLASRNKRLRVVEGSDGERNVRIEDMDRVYEEEEERARKAPRLDRDFGSVESELYDLLSPDESGPSGAPSAPKAPDGPNFVTPDVPGGLKGYSGPRKMKYGKSKGRMGPILPWSRWAYNPMNPFSRRKQYYMFLMKKYEFYMKYFAAGKSAAEIVGGALLMKRIMPWVVRIADEKKWSFVKDPNDLVNPLRIAMLITMKYFLAISKRKLYAIK